MNLRNLALSSAVAVLTASQTSYAQTPTNAVYSLVTNMRCKPGKTVECEAYLTGPLHKAMQARVDKGHISGYTLTRLMDPLVVEAGYTHTYVVSSDKPFPAEPSAGYRNVVEEAVGMSDADYQAKSNEVRDLVSRYRSKTVAVAGDGIQKGDFIRTYSLKTPAGKRAELRENMQSFRAPMMDQLMKGGRLRRWTFRELMNRGEADAFNATESITYKDAEMAMAEPPSLQQAQAAFAKGAPGKDYQYFLEKRRELNHVVMVRTSKIIDLINK